MALLQAVQASSSTTIAPKARKILNVNAVIVTVSGVTTPKQIDELGRLSDRPLFGHPPLH